MDKCKLNNIERINRVGLGAALIIFSMLITTGAMGLMAVLPLIATLPIFSGLFGYDPVCKFIGKEISHLANLLRHNNTFKPQSS